MNLPAAQHETTQLLFKDFEKLFIDASRNAAQVHGQFDTVTVNRELAARGPVYAQWLSLIMLTSATLRLTFKVFYDMVTARNFAAQGMESEAEKLKEHSIAFCMREYLIFIAEEAAKKVASEQHILLGISLPIVTRGFDEVFSALPRYGSQFETQWNLETAAGNFICHLVIQGNLK